MHRSGTSMICHMLEELGLFMGAVKGKAENNEARFFRIVNDWLLRQSGAAWDHPEAIQYLLERAEMRALAVDHIRYLMQTPHSIIHLGLGKYIRYRTPTSLDIPWGWKDPRNTYTLPIWLDLLPEAKVIHIHRNGVDVAASLRARARTHLVGIRGWVGQYKKRRGIALRFMPNYPALSLRCLSLEEGFGLWEAYTKRADKYIATLPETRAISIGYENFLADPTLFLGNLCQFCGLDHAPVCITEVASNVDPTRARAYERDPELMEFYKCVRNSSQMRRYGY
jgi:hypothetical protein